MSDPIQTLLMQSGEMQGQLRLLTQIIQQNHDSTNQRINDMRHSIEGQIATVERRVEKLESNERATAIKGAGASALMVGAIEVFKYAASRFS